MKHLRIWLGDLTHDTVGLATEVVPLNVGYVAAYCRKQYGDSVQLSIFKYIHKLEEAIERDPPDILALSNYPWCHRVGLALLDGLAARRPEALRVMGGPNFPHDRPSQHRFMQECHQLDAYVYLDGEVGFANLVRVALESESLLEARNRLGAEPVPGCVQRSVAGGILATPEPIRLRELDEIPSPYLSGLLDPFFDGRLSPMIQTTRGCPFHCSFCADGSELVDRVNSFSTDRVRQEIQYIAERVPAATHSLFISDLNFGMFKRDLEICDALAQARQQFNYPSYIDSTTGKNSKGRIINAIGRLDGALRLTMSVQSLTDEVLRNIDRENIRVDDFLALQPAIRATKVPTVSEVILGLPGETLESHVRTLSDLLEVDIDFIAPFTLMMIHGASMNTPQQRDLWGLQTKYRVIPRDFTKLRSGRNVVEIEEVAVASKSMSFRDYVEARKVALLIQSVNSYGFKALLRFLRQHGIRAMELIARLLEEANSADTKNASSFVTFVRDFERDTHSELWDSAEALERFVGDDDNFQALLDGRYGRNLLQSYNARLIATVMPQFAEAVFDRARDLVRQGGLPSHVWADFDQVERFCRGRIHNLLGTDRLSTMPVESLGYDFGAWIADVHARPLDAFKLAGPRLFRFELTQEQYLLVEHALDLFGHTPEGRAKAMIRVSTNTLWRTPVATEAHSIS